jgi:hypothetical protein
MTATLRKPMDEALRQMLLEMIAEDERVRARLAADGSLYDGYHPEMERVHTRNADALARFLNDGWPGVSRVGRDGAEAAWRIVQHAIGHPDFQRRCVLLIRAAVDAGDAEPQWVAMLTDRIRCFEGRPQLYGTQFDWDEQGQVSPRPIEDESGVDARRAGVGLPPLADAVAAHRKASAGAPRPTDPERHRAAYEAWRRRAGWAQSDR